MTASNGVPVTIRWHSSNSSLYSVSGRVNKQFYGGGSKGATLTATATAGSNTAEKVNKGTIDIPISWSKNGDRNVATLRYGGASYRQQF